MARQQRRGSGGAGSDGESPTGVDYPPSERELVLVAEPGPRLRATPEGVTSATGADVSDLAALLADANIAIEPLFGTSEDRLERIAAHDPSLPDLSRYYRVRAEDKHLDVLREQLAGMAPVAAAYVKPGAQPAAASVAPPGPAPAATGDFTVRQGYLGPAPEGVDAVWAHGEAGGRGAGLGIIDVEGAWLFSHEDLAQNIGGVIAGTPTDDVAWRNHGTAVIGEFGGDDNGMGVVGIAPDAQVRGASIFGGFGSSAAIRAAADQLGAGDVILIELHRPGPRHAFAVRSDQAGYIALEWWPDDFDAIRYAVGRGVVVVGAAGNGAEHLDDAIYDQPATGFPATWRNPFNPANPSSEAVVVGAGAPPPGTHGRDHGPDRSRLGFSNHGRRVDAQGWGREVTTTGGRGGNAGDLQGGADEEVWYSDTFSGTSSASPIVVGAIACIQGILAARGLARMTPAQAIATLRATGSPQTDAPGRPATQRIGNRPDIRAAVAHLAPPVVVSSGVATQYWHECVAYPPGDTASLWLFVDSAWRHHDAPDASTLDLVQRAFLSGASRVRVWYDGDTVAGLVVEGS